MYPYELKLKAVKTCIKNNLKYTETLKELNLLGIVYFKTLKRWVIAYNKGTLDNNYTRRKSKYTIEQKKNAVEYYKTHGNNFEKTAKDIGYGTDVTIKRWLNELDPEYETYCKKESSLLKKEVAIASCTGILPDKKIMHKYNLSKQEILSCKNTFLGEKNMKNTEKIKNITSIDSSKELRKECKKLLQEVSKLSNDNKELVEKYNILLLKLEEMEKQAAQAELKKDIYETAAAIIKKDEGINLDLLSNKEKTLVIDALRNKYVLRILLEEFKISKSSYCYQRIAINTEDKYKNIRLEISKIFKDNYEAYGYRRIYYYLKNKGNIISEKVIKRLMKEENLIVQRTRMKKYSSYMGEISPAPDNILNRKFHANKPNKIWLTDITEFSIPSGKIYLSPIIDCFDGLPVSWSIGTTPNSELVNNMLKTAIKTLKEGEKPIIHSDRGVHYRWPEWIKITEKHKLTRSMSRKGNSGDNSACEGFFGRLKNEMFYGRNWNNISIKTFICILNDYMNWYSSKRLKITLDGLSPINYRKFKGLLD